MQNYLTRLITVFLCAALHGYGAETRQVSPEELGGVAENRQQDLEVVSGLSAQEMWDIFLTDTVPSGVTNLTVSVAHDGRAYGSYANMPTIANIDPIDGILLTSGWATYAIGPNDSEGDYYGENTISAPNDPDLDAIINNASYPTFHSTNFIIEFDTDTSVHGISFDFIYGSEEYIEFVGNIFNDLFCCFLDGKNISFDGNGQVINVNNDFFQVSNLNGSLNLQFDGFTPLLRSSDSLSAGHHVVKFVIADVSDPILTSGVFLNNFRFKYSGSGTVQVKELIDNQRFSVMENSPGGTFVGEVLLKVPDSMGVKLKVLNGVPEFDFDINSREITVANGADLDYETQNIYYMDLIATAYDTTHDTARITIDILDYTLGDLIDDQIFYVKEKSPAGTFVGEVLVKIDSVVVTLQVIQDVPEFDFDAASREIEVATGADLDYETQNTYYMTMLATAKETKDDTALITIKILDSLEIPEPPAIDSAVIYDRDGDGVGDSVQVIFKSDLGLFKPYKADLVWPANGASYNLTIQDSDISGMQLALPFTPAAGAGVITKGTGTVTVYFDSTSVSYERTGDVLDGIGPLLKDTAWVVERFSPGADTFIVTFTEEVVVSEITDESFILLKDSDEITVSVIGTAQSITGDIEVTFAADLGGVNPAAGDSLKIDYTGQVVDSRRNSAHPDNTPVPIAILSRPVPITAAGYYDTDGDGIVNQVRISFEKDISDPHALKAEFTWQSDGEDGTVDQLEYLNTGDHKVLKAEIENIFSTLLKNRTSGDMAMALEYKKFGATVNYPVSDKAGPVLTEAVYCPSSVDQNGISEGFDTLVVKFSEKVVDIKSDKPFDLLFMENNTPYHFTLKQMSISSNRATFEVQEIVNVTFPVDGDSIRIDYKENVADKNSNAQEVEKNKRVRLTVKEIPFTFKITVIGPADPNTFEIPDILLSDKTKINNGTVVLLDPIIEISDEIFKNIDCSIGIYDAVGNPVAASSGFEEDNGIVQINKVKIEGKNKIAIIWTGQNENGRGVGQGAYLGRILITYPRGNTKTNLVMIGVKR